MITQNTPKADVLVERLDTLLNEIKQNGFGVGLVKTDKGIKIYTENSSKERYFSDYMFHKVEVESLSYESVDTDTVTLISILENFALREKLYGFMSLTRFRENGGFHGNSMPDVLMRNVLVYDDLQPEKYTSGNVTWYPLVERFGYSYGKLEPVFYNRDVIQVGVNDETDGGKFFYIVFVGSDTNGYIINDGHWKRYRVGRKG